MFIKKLILSTLIVLGAIASTQAQTFDFSCDTATDVEILAQAQTDFDILQDPLLSATQTATLVEDGFVEGGQYIGEYPNGMRYPDVNHYAVNIQLTPDGPADSTGYIAHPGITARVTIDAEDDGQFVVGTFNLHGRGGSYDTFDEAMAAANVILNDLDNNGFAIAEEEMAEELFDVNTEVAHFQYSRTIIISSFGEETTAHIRSFEGQFIATVDGEGSANADVSFDTLQEAMDFISSFIYTAN